MSDLFDGGYMNSGASGLNPTAPNIPASGSWTDMFTPSDATMASFAKMGPMLSVFGAINSAIGTFYQAKTQQYQLESQALSLDFQKSMANINARQAETTAQNIMRAGEQQAATVTMKYGAQKASQVASMAARGIQAGVGSAAETIATTDIMKETDALTINANTVRSAEAARMQKVNYENQGLLAGVSAENARTSAGSISPWMAAGSSMLSSAGNVAMGWRYKGY